ncbi:hypothetical protein MRB53_029364 [Persea americana]|uniref:Uncharacterized protein n=1 Tax=Persea americana TaxID=3435 RepID=A0ACC2KI85_PERAE|nr:hypothetical protein MRB53_029364 [Persea americana]
MNGGHTFDEELLEDHLDDVNLNEENDLNSALASADEVGTSRMCRFSQREKDEWSRFRENLKGKLWNEFSPMSTKKNSVFNAIMDDEMLTLLQEQTEMGKKGDRGFKEEAYNAIASAMIESSNGAYVMTSSSVKNRYKHLKQLYYAMKEMVNASGFRYDPVSKRVVADEALWSTWLEQDH